ncbi:MAG: Nramp family divalent metal transporter [Candidatus Woesebacteria bacterium]|jgi:hypothetical protein
MTTSLKEHKTKPLPKALSLRKIIGPSFIILGLGLGSGEVILWPYLASQYGMGMIWGAVLGLTLQFFMNMEIERYALARGESIFVGFARKARWLPFWFALSTFIPWMWPGIVASSATLISHIFGISDVKYVSVGLLVLMGLILSLGPVLYKTVETLQKVLIIAGVPSIFVISIMLAKPQDWTATAQGLVGVGDGYWLFPVGIGLAFIATKFTSALAYAGAGGNLNLAQSFYVREKGFGMGKYAGRITSLFTGKKENVSLEGFKFADTAENTKQFKKWWRTINTEHFLVFWLTGSITIILLSLLAYTTTYHVGGLSEGIGFVVNEANVIGERLVPAIGIFFLIVVSLTLFGTQLTVFDATSRIIAENAVLSAPKMFKANLIPKIYYAVLWLFISVGIIISLFFNAQPLQLLVIAAVLNAFAMFVHSGLTVWLNRTNLPKSIRINNWRTAVMVFACVFYGVFSIFVIVSEVQKLFK